MNEARQIVDVGLSIAEYVEELHGLLNEQLSKCHERGMALPYTVIGATSSGGIVAFRVSGTDAASPTLDDAEMLLGVAAGLDYHLSKHFMVIDAKEDLLHFSLHQEEPPLN